MHRSVRRAAATAAAVVAFSGIGAAYAAWTGNGAGSVFTKASANEGLSTVDASASVAGYLYPLGSSDVVIKIRNPNPYPVTVTGIVGTGPIAASGGLGSCVDTGVTFVDQTGAWNIPATAEALVTLANAAQMSNDSEDGCQGAVFTIPIGIGGVSGG